MFHSPLVNYYWRRADKIKANPFTSKLAWCDHPRWSNYFAHAMVALLAASQTWHSNFDRDEQQVRFLAFRFAVQRISPTWRPKKSAGGKNHKPWCISCVQVDFHCGSIQRSGSQATFVFN